MVLVWLQMGGILMMLKINIVKEISKRDRNKRKNSSQLHVNQRKENTDKTLITFFLYFHVTETIVFSSIFSFHSLKNKPFWAERTPPVKAVVASHRSFGRQTFQ